MSRGGGWGWIAAALLGALTIAGGCVVAQDARKEREKRGKDNGRG